MIVIYKIHVSEDFSATPGGRFIADGEFSGERFRDQLLRPALANNDCVEITLDGTRGYGSSFLEEAFGGLIRLGYFSKDEIRRKLKINAGNQSYEHYKRLIEKYIEEAR